MTVTPFIFRSAALVLLFCLSVRPALGQVLTADTFWQGEVRLEEDVLVPAGVTLTVAAGTRIMAQPADNTKIDPEYLSHQTELLVRGRLLVNGNDSARVSFQAEGEAATPGWAGIIVDGGEVLLAGADLRNAEAALTVVAGKVDLAGCRLTGNRYGLVAQSEKAVVSVVASIIEKNDYGVMAFDGAVPILAAGSLARDNSKEDVVDGRRAVVAVPAGPATPAAEPRERPVAAVYRDEALPGTTIWKGRVVVEGQLRCPPASRLIILPGTVVEFVRKDSNGDGIGENGLQIQGQLVAKGTEAEPIIFRSAEKDRRRGDWDSINILGSDLAQNLLEYCRIEDAYRGLHFHYSNVAVNQLILHNNYRGAQFQESLVRVSGSRFSANKSAIQARDSEVVFSGNQIFDNLNGANFYRLDLEATDNLFGGNLWDGLRVRESRARVSGNLLAGNRMGLLISDATSGAFSGNVLSGNLEAGLLIRDTTEVAVTGNAVTGNGITGISLRDTGATLTGNLIAGNGERGVGVVSFSGVFRANNLAGNGKYAVGLEGAGNFAAAGNWWGESDLAREIYDRHDEPGLGEVDLGSRLARPTALLWPLATLASDALWAGEVRADRLLTVPEGVTLAVLPGTVSRFDGEAAGLMVNGRLLAEGRPERRIVFTSQAAAGPGDWAGISLERAVGSRIANCDFRFAEWGLHIHFVPMTISGCRFLDNDGGIRFRSGPMLLTRSLFSGNRVGVRAYLGRMEISENEFFGNEIAIFVREGGEGVAINRNNLHDNERYNLRLGDFNTADVDARENWWGGPDPLATIFDGRREAYIGKVIYEPFLANPLALGLNNLLPAAGESVP